MSDVTEKQVRTATAGYSDGILSVATGEIERSWMWTGSGFATTVLAATAARRVWPLIDRGHRGAGPDGGAATGGKSAGGAGPASIPSSDWLLPILPGSNYGRGDAPPALPIRGGHGARGSQIGVYYPARSNNPPAELLSVRIEPDTDDGFTSEHLHVVADIEYRADRIALQFRIWVYPDAPGIRTQLLAKALPGFTADATRFTGRVEHLPLELQPSMRRRAIGYFNDTQNRNDTDTDILHEVVYYHSVDGPEWYRRPSALCVEDDDGGIALVKESHKCPNQRGHDTGMFHLSAEIGLACTGWGLLPSELREDRYREAWAHWSIAWAGGDFERKTAFKRFDAIRYPIDPKRDIYIIANTWGSSWKKETAQGAAAEEIVRAEIDSQADLGIDVQQIDDGWQGSGYDSWRPVEARHPEGWKAIREYAAKKGVDLGLWAAAMPISLEDLKRNYDEGGFVQYKLDFARLANRDDIDSLMDKVRRFILYTDHAVRVNWDVTENPPRYGYFFGREYGSLYLENRKPAWPHSAVYIPHTVLRDVWQLSSYLNLHKIQCSVQNVDRVDPDLSDAPLYSHAYCVAITLMGTPIFFQQTRFYSPEAREAIRPVLSAYKRHREAMYAGIVYPIGEKPDNRSWTGFQCILPGGSIGYLTVFRELHNRVSTHRFQLRGVGGDTGGRAAREGARPNGQPAPPTTGARELRLTDLLRDETLTVAVDANGGIELAIDAPADFRFYRYEISD